MFKLLNRMKGQSTLEYAVLIIIIGALLTIQVYIKRGVQGRLKSASDDIGDQFSPGNTNMVKSTKVHSVTKELFGVDNDGTTAKQGVSTSLIVTPESTNTTEKAQIINVEQEYWGSEPKSETKP